MPGFVEETAISGLTLPMAIRFAPDGRVFVAEKSGRVKVYPALGSTGFTVLTDLSQAVSSYWDRGLLGIALHLDFPVQLYLHLLYTTDILGFNDVCPSPPGPPADGCLANARLSRIQVGSNSTQVGPEVVMLNGHRQQYPSHSVGNLQFGPDGSLYVSAGDGASFTFTDYGQRGNPCGDPPVRAGVNQSLPGAQERSLRSQGPRRSGSAVTYDGTIRRIDPITRDGSSSLVLGSHVNGNVEYWAGRFHRALILDGIGSNGTVVANPEFTTTSQLTSTPPNYTT